MPIKFIFRSMLTFVRGSCRNLYSPANTQYEPREVNIVLGRRLIHCAGISQQTKNTGFLRHLSVQRHQWPIEFKQTRQPGSQRSQLEFCGFTGNGCRNIAHDTIRRQKQIHCVSICCDPVANPNASHVRHVRESTSFLQRHAGGLSRFRTKYSRTVRKLCSCLPFINVAQTGGRYVRLRTSKWLVIGAIRLTDDMFMPMTQLLYETILRHLALKPTSHGEKRLICWE